METWLLLSMIDILRLSLGLNWAMRERVNYRVWPWGSLSGSRGWGKLRVGGVIRRRFRWFPISDGFKILCQTKGCAGARFVPRLYNLLITVHCAF